MESLQDVSDQGYGGKVSIGPSLLYLTGNVYGRKNLFNCLLVGICVPSVISRGLSSMEKYFTAQTPK